MTVLSLTHPPPAGPKPGRGATYQSIQALRGAAALLVTIFHAGLRLDPASPIFRVGNAGVDIFFVISGFVMWTVTTSRPPPPLVFLWRRFVRLVPLYWLLTLVTLAGWAIAPAAFPRMHPTVSHLLLSLAFIPHVSPDTGSVTPVLGQGWTLNFEMFFYGLFAATLMLPARARLPAIGAVLMGLPLLGLALAPLDWPVITLLSPLLIEFLIGIGLARLAAGPWRPGAPLCWAACGIGVALLATAAPAAGDDLARLLQYGAPASLIVAGAVGAEAAGRLSVPGLPRLLGDASYSIYLVHPFAISLLYKIWPSSLAPWLFIAAASVLAAGFGSAVYATLEKPLLALARRWRMPGLGAAFARL